MISLRLSLLVYLSLSLLSSITQPPPVVLCTTTSTTSRDKQPAKSDGLCSTDEMMYQMNLQDQNELEQQGNNPAQPLEVPQLPAQPAEDPVLPLEWLEHHVLDIPTPHELEDFLQTPIQEVEDQVLQDITQLPAQPPEDPLIPLEWSEHQVLDIPTPHELEDFLQTPIEELKDQVLLDITQLPAQPPEDPQLPDQVPGLPQSVNQTSTAWVNSHYSPLIPAQPVPQPPDEVPVLPQPVNQMSTSWDNSHYSPLIPAQPVPQPPDQVPVLPQPVNQMSTAWDNSHYSPLVPAGITSNSILSCFTGIVPYLLSLGIVSNNSFLTGITPYPLSSRIASNNGHYNPSSTGICQNNNSNPLSARLNPQLPAAQGLVFLQPSQEDGCNVPSSVMTSGNNDGNKDGNNDGKNDRDNDGRPIPGTKAYRNEHYDHFVTYKKPYLNIEKKIRYLVRKEASDIRPRKKGRFVGNLEAEPSHRYRLGASDPDDTGSGSGSVIPSTTRCTLPTQQDASLQSQELASQNNELRSQVHRQGHEGLIPPNWPNAPSESGDEATNGNRNYTQEEEMIICQGQKMKPTHRNRNYTQLDGGKVMQEEEMIMYRARILAK